MLLSLKKRLEAEMNRHESALEELAEERINLFEKEWKKTRKSSIELIFGMGAFDVRVSGKLIDKYGYCTENYPQIIKDLEKDLDDITDQYRAVCPNNRTISNGG